MANRGEISLMSLLITLMVATAPHAEAAVTCATVLTSISSCLAYLKTGGAPPPACCAATKSLNSASRTTPDRQAVCGCIKELVPKVGAKAELVNNIITKCGVTGVGIPYRFSPSLDCSKVH